MHLSVTFAYFVAPPLLCAQNCGGNSALHLAALSGHVAVLELLIEAGADLNAENSVRSPSRCPGRPTASTLQPT